LKPGGVPWGADIAPVAGDTAGDVSATRSAGGM